MSLSNDLIAQFVKTVKPEPKEQKESIVYGTIVKNQNGDFCVELDGCDKTAEPTPIAWTSGIKEKDRVLVLIKNHSATVIGNIDDPSATNFMVNAADSKAQDAFSKAQEALDRVMEVDDLIADKVSTEQLAATNASIETLRSDMVKVTDELDTNKLNANEAEVTYAKITRVEALEGRVDELDAGGITVDELDAKYAQISDLEATDAKVDELDADYATFKSTTTQKISANEGEIEDLKTDKLSADAADLKYANIDFSNIGKAAIEHFYATSGLIEDVVVGDGTITGKLVGVTISGDLIEGNTVKAEKLVIKGSDGLYYKLNTDGMKTEAEQTDQNSLNGSIIKAKSITATKISVSDLVAFGATIGGIHIAEGSMYSGTKSSVDNATSGFYLGKDGQMAVGNSSQWIKFYKLQNGNYALSISAEQLIMSGSGKSVADEIAFAQRACEAAQSDIDNLEIGGRNLITKDSLYTLACAADIKSTNNISVTAVSEYNSSRLLTDTYYDPGVYTLNATGSVSTKEFRVLLSAQVDNGWTYNEYYNDTGHGYFQDVTLPYTFTLAEPFMLGFVMTAMYGPQVITDLKLEKGNRATGWTPAPEDTDSDIERAKDRVVDAYNKINSRGEQLITNGNAFLGNNTNFTGLVYDGAEANGSGGSFTLPEGTRYGIVISDEYVPVDPKKTYETRVDIKTKYGLSSMYAMLVCEDIDHNQIFARHHMYIQGSLTAFAADLKPGDTVMHLTDVSGWSTTAFDGTHAIVWNETNSFGYAYTPETYSRTNIDLLNNEYYLSEDAVDRVNNTVTLLNAYTGPTIPAGTKVSQGSDGGTYKYVDPIAKVVPTEWTTYVSHMSGMDYSGTNADYKFPPGTAYVKFGFLWTYNPVNDQVWVTNISLTDVTSANDANEKALSAQTAADNAQSTANSAESRITEAEALIEVLSESISMLVTDGNGASLMTQTENGWTFSTASLQDLANKTSEALEDLTREVGDINGAVDILQQAVDDLGTIAEYVKIGIYEDEPCIELGESDSNFKLRITNTRMVFSEGPNVLAYFNNQSLHIKKAVVEEELQQGGFVWKIRSNGNLALVWKGDEE